MVEQEIDLNIDYYNKTIVNEGLDELADLLYPSSESIGADFFDIYFNDFLDQLSYNFEHD